MSLHPHFQYRCVLYLQYIEFVNFRLDVTRFLWTVQVPDFWRKSRLRVYKTEQKRRVGAIGKRLLKSGASTVNKRNTVAWPEKRKPESRPERAGRVKRRIALHPVPCALWQIGLRQRSPVKQHPAEDEAAAESEQQHSIALLEESVPDALI